MSGKPWTRVELAQLRHRYPHEPTAIVARALGRSVSAAYNMADKLGLAKSSEYMGSPAAHHFRRGEHKGWEHRFAKGHKTWNKGKHHKPAGSEKGYFKPGDMPHNTQPIGTEKLDKDGVLLRKVSNNRSRYSRWLPVHRIVWERKHGPVPRGMIVVFKPGQKTADASRITPERLECITRHENMRRNSRHTRYGPELNRLMQLRGALKLKIRNHEARKKA